MLGLVRKGERIYEKVFIFGFNSHSAFMPNANHLGFCGIRYDGGSGEYRASCSQREAGLLG